MEPATELTRNIPNREFGPDCGSFRTPRNSAFGLLPDVEDLILILVGIPTVAAHNVVYVRDLTLVDAYLAKLVLFDELRELIKIPIESFFHLLVMWIHVLLADLSPILYKPVALDLKELCSCAIGKPESRRWRRIKGLQLDINWQRGLPGLHLDDSRQLSLLGCLRVSHADLAPIETKMSGLGQQQLLKLNREHRLDHRRMRKVR
jgi:hypothetical protein